MHSPVNISFSRLENGRLCDGMFAEGHAGHAAAASGRVPLQQWLGHSSLDTTQIYVHLTRKSAKKVMEATSL